MSRRSGRTKHYGAKAVAIHLRRHLGDPFSILREEVAAGAEISVHGFADVPRQGQVTLVSEGMSTYFRTMGSARSDGYAQELLMVVDRAYFGEAFLDFFMAVLATYTRHGELLTWEEPIRLASPVPLGKRLPVLLAMPAAVFDSEFSFARDGGSETNVVMLVPVHTGEADYLLSHGPEELYEQFEDQDVDVSDLDRDPIRVDGARRGAPGCEA